MTTQNARWLLCSRFTQRYAFGVARIVGIIPKPMVVPIPQVTLPILGVVGFRGDLITVIEPSRKNNTTVTISESALKQAIFAVVIVSVERTNIAIAVDAVDDWSEDVPDGQGVQIVDDLDSWIKAARERVEAVTTNRSALPEKQPQ